MRDPCLHKRLLCLFENCIIAVELPQVFSPLAQAYYRIANRSLPTPRRPSLPAPLVSFSVLAYLPVMSGQQCLRRLPAAMRSVRALRASPRCTPTARSYSALTKANSSGLLGQASRCRQLLHPTDMPSTDTPHRRPGQLSSQRLCALEQIRTYADTIVKVPEMAESITEGTLKQWSKRAINSRCSTAGTS